MYMLYIDDVLFPVAPGKIVTETEMDNNLYPLVDGSWVGKSGGRKPRKISFELLLPMREYPFAYYEGKYCDAEYYIEHLNRIAEKSEAVDFDLYRSYKGSDSVYLTSMKVMLEKINVIEDAKNLPDITVGVVLREARWVESRVAQETSVAKTERQDTFTLPETYTVKKGDSLWLISKLVYGDGAQFEYLAALNGIKKPYTIYTGQVLKLRE